MHLTHLRYQVSKLFRTLVRTSALAQYPLLLEILDIADEFGSSDILEAPVNRLHTLRQYQALWRTLDLDFGGPSYRLFRDRSSQTLLQGTFLFQMNHLSMLHVDLRTGQQNVRNVPRVHIFKFDVDLRQDLLVMLTKSNEWAPLILTSIYFIDV
jgi:hypothetical protein